MASERGWDESMWKQMAEEIGLAGLIVPERYGGADFGYVELCVVITMIDLYYCLLFFRIFMRFILLASAPMIVKLRFSWSKVSPFLGM